MIIHAVLGNPNHLEYGVASIPFPIPHDQYAHCMELLEALEIGDAVKADCQVQEINSFYYVLMCAKMLTVNVNPLDYGIAPNAAGTSYGNLEDDKYEKIELLILMALLAIAGLVVTFKPLMERTSRQKQVDEANDSFIQQLEQIQSVKDAEPEATSYAQLREQIEQYNTWLYESKQIALTNAAAYEQPAFILTQYGLQDETFGIIYIPKLYSLFFHA